MNIEKNHYDAHTLQPAIEQQQRLTGHILKNNFVDRGYRGIKNVLGTNIITPRSYAHLNHYQKQKIRHGFRRRAAIEPKIGHLKSDHRLSRNFYKGIFGDNINVMMAAAAMNFKRMMNKWKENLLLLFFVRCLQQLFYELTPDSRRKMAFLRDD